MKTNEEYAEEVKNCMIDAHIQYALELLINKEGLYENDEYEEFCTLISEYPPTYSIALYDDENPDVSIVSSCLYTYIFKENLPIDKRSIAELINLKDYTNEILDILSDTEYKLTYINKNKLEFQLSTDTF